MKTFNLFAILLWLNLKILGKGVKSFFKSIFGRARSASRNGMLFIIITTFDPEFVKALFSGLFFGLAIFCLIRSVKYLVLGELPIAKYYLYGFIAAAISFLIMLIINS
jgi:hypothetical protein